jgi:hypothetical protein
MIQSIAELTNEDDSSRKLNNTSRVTYRESSRTTSRNSQIAKSRASQHEFLTFADGEKPKISEHAPSLDLSNETI